MKIDINEMKRYLLIADGQWVRSFVTIEELEDFVIKVPRPYNNWYWECSSWIDKDTGERKHEVIRGESQYFPYKIEGKGYREYKIVDLAEWV